MSDLDRALGLGVDPLSLPDMAAWMASLGGTDPVTPTLAAPGALPALPPGTPQVAHGRLALPAPSSGEMERVAALARQHFEAKRYDDVLALDHPDAKSINTIREMLTQKDAARHQQIAHSQTVIEGAPLEGVPHIPPDSIFIQALIARTRAFLSEGNMPDVMTESRVIAACNPEAWEPHFFLAKKLYGDGDTRGALQEATKAKTFPLELAVLIAQLHQERGNIPAAYDIVEKHFRGELDAAASGLSRGIQKWMALHNKCMEHLRVFSERVSAYQAETRALLAQDSPKTVELMRLTVISFVVSNQLEDAKMVLVNLRQLDPESKLPQGMEEKLTK